MPSPSRRTHSWSDVYIRSAGTFIERFSAVDGLRNECATIAHERRLHDARAQTLVAHEHFDLIARRNAGGHARKCDRLAERGRKRAAGDLTFASDRLYALMRAQHAASIEQ